MGVLIQVLASIIVCFPCLNLGVLNSLPSSTLDDFTSVNTSLQRPMTEMEVNLYGSLSSAGALVSTPLVALLLDRLGRKYCTILAGLMGVMSWVILAYTNRVEIILAAVFLGGVCGTSFLIVPAFLGEFCQESIRGTMTAGSMVFYGVGTLFSYILGGYLEYMTMVYTAMGMAVVEVILMSWLKESPMLLLKKGHDEKAAASIAFYRQVKINSKVVFQEMASIRRSLNPNESELVPAEEGIDPEHKNTTITEEQAIDPGSKKSMWLYIKTSKPVQRGVFITLSLMSASVFQGIVVVQVFAEPIFVEAVPSQTATTCTLLLATAIVAASVLGAYLSDLAGRRPLMIYSSIAAGLCCVLLGTQMQLSWGPNWLTPILMYLFSITFSFGGGTVPFVVLAEVFLPEVKSFMTMISVVWMWLCYFLCLFVFYPLAAVVGLGGVFHVFGGVCFLSAVFAVFYVPETKGVTLEQVQIMLIEKRNY